jgi:hypothetical protein
LTAPPTSTAAESNQARGLRSIFSNSPGGAETEPIRGDHGLQLHSRLHGRSKPALASTLTVDESRDHRVNNALPRIWLTCRGISGAGTGLQDIRGAAPQVFCKRQ